MPVARHPRAASENPSEKSPDQFARQRTLKKFAIGEGALDHAVRIIYPVCCLAGAADLIDEICEELRGEGVPGAIQRHDTAVLFDWLTAALSYQGISDRVATDYMARHGRVRWAKMTTGLAAGPTCPKLKSYWAFRGLPVRQRQPYLCRAPITSTAVPLPGHDLRNGRLNQTAYSLFLFIRERRDA